MKSLSFEKVLPVLAVVYYTLESSAQTEQRRFEENKHISTECIPIHECPYYANVFEEQHETAKKTSSSTESITKPGKSVQSLWTKHICGFDRKQVKVECPIYNNGLERKYPLKKKVGIHKYLNNKSPSLLMETFHKNVLFSHFSSNGMQMAQSKQNKSSDRLNKRDIYRTLPHFWMYQPYCFGSLVLTHGRKANGHMVDIRTVRLQHKKYKKINWLTGREVLLAQIDGNCCWKVYTRTSFRGRSQQLSGDVSTYLLIQPKSIKKTQCM